MLRAIVYCDLVGLDEESARKMLLRGVAKTPFRPDFVVFPGATAKAKQGFERNSQQEYPGAGSSVVPDQLQDLSRSAFSIFSLLQTTRTTFDAQARLRNTLVKHVHQRLVLDPFRKWEYEPFIAFYYPDLDDEERRMFSTMRSFTSNILRDYNRQILALIGETPDLVIRIPRIADLRSHLVVWLAKYEGTFVNTPQMCLLYTGVEEGVPFPHGIESELLRFLQEGPGSPRLATPESHIAEEGSSSNDLHWRLPLEKKFVKRRIQEIIRERQNAQSRAAPGTDVAVLEQLKALDIELAGLVARRMYPQMMWRPIAVPDSLLIGVRELLKLPDRDLPEEFRAALAKTSTVAETVNSSPLHLKLFVSQLPTLAFYAGVLGQGELPSEWERFRDQLSSWTMAEND